MSAVAAVAPSEGVGWRWSLVSWSATLLVLGALSTATAWSGWVAALVLAAAALVPLLLVRVGLGLGVSRWATTAVLVLLLLLVGYLLASSSGASPAESVRDAVPRLLSTARPYPLRADLLVAPVLLAGLVSLLVGLRLGSRSRVEPVAGAAVLYAAGALLTTGAGDRWGLLAVLLLASALAGWVFLDDHSEPAAQRLAVAGPVVVIGAGLLASVALVPVQDPFEPRDLVDPPLVQVQAVSPLPMLGAWAANPDLDLLTVRGDAVPLRLVVLDRYDGSQWRAATAYAPFGTEIASAGAARRTSHQVAVTLDGLGGGWLPTPGEPSALSVPDVLVDPSSGTLFRAGESVGLSYAVTGVVDDPDPALLRGATVPTDPAIARYLALPALPPALEAYSRAVTAGRSEPYDRALAIESAVRTGRTLSAKAISGSAFWRIKSFLVGRAGTPGGRIGTSEQFATAFAVIARDNGLPTRLVVGFRPGEVGPDGDRVVRGRDALAWPEVYFADLGWVPFAPTPDDRGSDADRPRESQLPLPSDTTAGRPGDSGQRVARPRGRGAEDALGGSAAWLRWALPVGAITVVLALLVLLRALRSRRHRRRGDRGAWAEVLDALHLAGTPPPRSASPTQIARTADRRLGLGVTTAVATASERAAFGPVGPAGPATTWADARAVGRAVRRSLPWWRRVWWAVDPRVLRR